MSAGFASSGSGGQGFAIKLEKDGDTKLGNSDGDLHQVTGTLQLNENVFFLANGRVGLGDSAPSHKLSVGGSMEIGQYIYHKGDNNTFINFTDNRIRINAGGNNHIDCQDESSAPHKVRINNGGNNIDFVIKDNSNNVYFTADASTSRVGIGIDTPTAILHVSQSADPGGDNSLFRVDAFSQTNPAIDIKDNGTESYVGINREAGTNALTVEPHSAGSLAIRVTNGHLGTTQDNYGLKIGTAGKTLVHDGTDFVFDDSLKVSGDTNVTGQFARGVASVNLGSGTTSTLNPATSGAGTLLVTASSITTPAGGAANEGMHICSLADGTIAGQVLTIIIVSNFLTGAGGASDMGVLLITPNTPLNSSTGIVTFTGSAMGGNPQGSTAVLMWTGSAWAVLSTRRGGGSA